MRQQKNPEGYAAVFGAVWAVWILVTFAAHLFGGWWWAVCLGLFAVAEGIGVARKGRPDTWSELVWAFLRGGWSRGILVAGWVAFVGFSMMDLAGLWPPAYGLARTSLVVGLCGWLAVHFFRFGRNG